MRVRYAVFYTVQFNEICLERFSYQNLDWILRPRPANRAVVIVEGGAHNFFSTNLFLDSVHKYFLNQTWLHLQKEKNGDFSIEICMYIQLYIFLTLPWIWKPNDGSANAWNFLHVQKKPVLIKPSCLEKDSSIKYTQRVLALCEFHYCDYSKLSRHIWPVPFLV